MLNCRIHDKSVMYDWDNVRTQPVPPYIIPCVVICTLGPIPTTKCSSFSNSAYEFPPSYMCYVLFVFPQQRHGRRVKKLGKPADQRKALLRALTTEVN